MPTAHDATEAVCLRNEIARGSKDYLGWERMLMLFHSEIMRVGESEGTLRDVAVAVVRCSAISLGYYYV